jgi:YidC/Oxa1 family membrane protein insertase
MDQKTLIGFILIGAILLFWPTYLDIISPEKEGEEPSQISRVLSVQDAEKKDVVLLSQEEDFGSEKVFKIETPLFSTEITNKNGGSFSSFFVKKHLKKDESSLNLIDSENLDNLLVSYINQSGEEKFLSGFWSLADGFPGGGSLVLSEKNPEITLSYFLLIGGSRVQKDITLSYDSYKVIINTNLRDIRGGVLDGNYRLDWVGGLPITEPSQDPMFLEGLVGQGGDIESYRVGSAGIFGSSNENIERDSKQYTGSADFVGYRTKYFSLFFVPQKTDFVEISKYSSGGRVAVDITAVQDINFEKTILFFGPLEYGEISDLGVGIEEKILGWQWLSSVSWLVYSIMIFMYGLIPNYGVVVILFAVLIKLVTYPLMAKQLRSSKKMQEINPLLNNIKTKYKNNPTLQQQKIAALFQEHKINPLAGCLPMLIQMPILMSVFMVFRNTIEFRGESFVFWISDLSAADTLFELGGIPVNVLPFLMSASMYYTMQLSAPSAPGGDPAQEATQQMMKYMFPGMMFFLFYGFPSGLNLYYLCFNLMQIVQQKIINKEA